MPSRRPDNFIPLLRSHILARLMDRRDYEDFTAEELDRVHIEGDRMFRHKTLRVNYTTYDMRREQDAINPRKHADFMVLAQEDDYAGMPYWYCRLLDIFHAYVRYDGPGYSASRKWQRLDFLWVRWYDHDMDYPSGFLERRLPRLRFLDASDPDSVPFGFVDPCEVIRAAHIIPAFAHGTTEELLGPSKLARRGTAMMDSDYEYYHVGIFADRDMYMRHLGGGVGHRGIGISVAQSREHARRRVRAVTPDLSSESEYDNGEVSSIHHTHGSRDLDLDDVVDDGRAELQDEEPLEDESAEHDSVVDDDWHPDIGLGGGLVAEEPEDVPERDAEDAGGYYDDDGELMDPYAMEGFAPL
ncbi:hypothetical protein NUW54_g3842 [Trametes sanguinea]|uniref:Uncharacterized protein n=1 Tax=Trametes sanguinea TaxID=158606 RepID=A0ACC1Q1R5_9APHY|nr:hypothetical protein NUW54_g3842 [Trametes sanguinea]